MRKYMPGTSRGNTTVNNVPHTLDDMQTISLKFK